MVVGEVVVTDVIDFLRAEVGGTDLQPSLLALNPVSRGKQDC